MLFVATRLGFSVKMMQVNSTSRRHTNVADLKGKHFSPENASSPGTSI